MLKCKGNKFDSEHDVIAIFNNEYNSMDLTDLTGDMKEFKELYPDRYEAFIKSRNASTYRDCIVVKGKNKEFAVLNGNEDDFHDYRNVLLALCLLTVVINHKTIAISYPTVDTKEKLEELEELEKEYGVTFKIFE